MVAAWNRVEKHYSLEHGRESIDMACVLRHIALRTTGPGMSIKTPLLLYFYVCVVSMPLL